jgi:hypothetical protein
MEEMEESVAGSTFKVFFMKYDTCAEGGRR